MEDNILKKPNNAVYQVRGVNPQRFDAILKHAGKTILDVGCGSGAYVLKIAQEYPQYQIKGVDYQYFESWKEKPDNFLIADAFSLPFEDNSFDTITLFEVLEHLPNPEKALAEYLRVCRKNLILTVPNCDRNMELWKSNLIYSHWFDNTHVNFYTLDTIKEEVTQAGFKVKEAYLINRLNIQPLINDAFDLSGMVGSLLLKLLKKREIHDYKITSLIVAEK